MVKAQQVAANNWVYCLALANRTTLIVAHRLSAVKQADVIYVLEDGQVSQSGTHYELVNKEGLYQTLYGSVQSDENQNDAVAQVPVARVNLK